jgi:hypothetical protein
VLGIDAHVDEPDTEPAILHGGLECALERWYFAPAGKSFFCAFAHPPLQWVPTAHRSCYSLFCELGDSSSLLPPRPGSVVREL